MNTHQTSLKQRRNCTLTTEKEFKGKSINTNKEKDQNCIEEILAPIHAHLTDITEKHNRIMTTRFDLRVSQETEDLTNKQVGRIFENMGRALDRRRYAGGHNPDPRFIGVPEDHGNGIHYHCLVLVNGNAIQNPYTIFNLAEKYLGKALGLTEEAAKGLVHYCNQQGENGIIIRRDSPDEEEKTNKVMHQASYLAKERGKENIPKGKHLWVGTRVPTSSKNKK